MSVVLNGTTQFLDLAATVYGGGVYPISLSLWMKTTDLDQTSVLGGFSEDGDDVTIAQFRGSVAGDYVAAAAYESAWCLATSTGGVSSGAWHHVLVVFAAVNSRIVYLDGGNKGTDATWQASYSGGIDFALGCRTPNGTPDLFFGGKLGDVALWTYALGDADAVSLAARQSPLTIQADSLQEYWKLSDDANSDGGLTGNDLTENGTPSWDPADHPVTYAGTGGAGVVAKSDVELANGWGW